MININLMYQFQFKDKKHLKISFRLLFFMLGKKTNLRIIYFKLPIQRKLPTSLVELTADFNAINGP